MNVPKLRFKEFDGEWEERKLKDLILTVEAGVSVNSKDASVSDTVSKAVLKTSAISKGNFNHKENKKVIEEDLERVKKPVKADTILVSRMNTPALVGEVGYVENDYPNLYLPDRLWEVEVDKEITTAKWLVSALVTDKNEYKIKSLGTGTSGSMKNIAKSDFLNINIKVPNLKEQIKIQSFICILNKKIQLQQQKIDLLQEQKKGFLQKMFPKAGETQPNLRFYGFKGEWRKYRLDRILKKDTQKNKDLEFHSEAILSVAQMKDAKNIRDSSDQYMTTYNKIRKGNLAFEGHSNKDFPNGRFILNDYRDGIVSHIYDVYRILIDHDMIFMKNYINNQQVMRKILINATSNARMMNSLNSQELLKQHIILPSIEEQKKISYFLLTLDNKIKLEENKLKSLIDQKKGFMQQMFI